MGRKAATGILYYQMDCDHIMNPKVKLLFKEHGAIGYWIWQCILATAYKVKGYYFDYSNDDDMILFADDVCKCPVEQLYEVINCCIKRKLFDSTISNKHKVLTCVDMQENYVSATSQRRVRGMPTEINSTYLLLPEIDKKGVVIVDNGSMAQCDNGSMTVEENKPEIVQPLPVVKQPAKIQPNKIVKPKDTEADLVKMYNELEKTGGKLLTFIETYRPTFIEPYVDLWNVWVTTRAKGKSKCLKITESRKKKFSIRIQEPMFNIREILTAASESTMCKTQSWFSFDFIIHSEENYIKVLEGKYKDSEKPEVKETKPVNEATRKMEELLKNNAL